MRGQLVTALEDARELDAEDDLVAAARTYEEALRAGEDGLPAILDLAVLYFTLLDPGEAAANHLSGDFLDQAWERANELLQRAHAEFGPNSEIGFWSRYFEYIVLGGDEFIDDCRSLANADESLVPFFYLWAAAEGKEYSNEARQLYHLVSSGKTARERYIRSMVDRAVR